MPVGLGRFSCNFDVSDDFQLNALEFSSFETWLVRGLCKSQTAKLLLAAPTCDGNVVEDGGFNNFALGQQWLRRSLLGVARIVTLPIRSKLYKSELR